MAQNNPLIPQALLFLWCSLLHITHVELLCSTSTGPKACASTGPKACANTGPNFVAHFKIYRPHTPHSRGHIPLPHPPPLQPCKICELPLQEDETLQMLFGAALCVVASWLEKGFNVVISIASVNRAGPGEFSGLFSLHEGNELINRKKKYYYT
jgi:hypothetical protein